MKHAENIFNKLMRKHEQLEKCYVNNETINMQINSYAYINITIFWSCLSALYNSCVLLLIIGVLYVHSWCVSCAHIMYTRKVYVLRKTLGENLYSHNTWEVSRIWAA